MGDEEEARKHIKGSMNRREKNGEGHTSSGRTEFARLFKLLSISGRQQ